MQRLIPADRLRNNQDGMAAIVITMILMVLISTIVLAVTGVTAASSHREVDSRLNTIAKYAAESGVNDAIAYLQANGTLPVSDTDCTSFIDDLDAHYHRTNVNVLSSSPSASYTCLTVQGAPSNLQTTVYQNRASVIRIDPTAHTNTLSFTWPISSNPENYPISNCNTSLEFAPSTLSEGSATGTAWDCPYPMLRLDLYRYKATDTTPALLQNDTDTLYLFPTDSASQPSPAVTFGSGSSPAVVLANCNTTTCTAKLSLPAASSPASFTDGYASLYSIYQDAQTVTIGGQDGVSFQNSQVEIDSTGDAAGFLQRIDVRVAYNNNGGTAPAYGVDAISALCKRYRFDTLGNVNPGLTVNTFQEAPLCGLVLKPAIYLYPSKTEKVNVKLYFAPGLVQTIPKYNANTGWNVLAHPSGTLTNLIDGKQYPYLYWEGNFTDFNFDMKQGFVVPGSDTEAFLQHELPIIGLNKTETAAFIQYWLPKMEHNPYSLIHFAGKQYTSQAPLTITPAPDSMLRVFMAEESISHPVQVTAQTFPAFHRTGFTVVEWGGSILSPAE